MPLPGLSQEKYHDPNPVISFVIRRFFERIRVLATGLGARSVLDTGSGEGEILRRRILPAEMATVCLDLSTASLAEVRSHSSPSALVCGSVLSLPFAPASFDLVLCMEVLEHLENPLAAVRETARVAREAIIFSVPHEPYFCVGNALRGKHLSRFGNHPEHVQHWNIRTFRAFLSQAFADVRIASAFPWIVACCRPSHRDSG